MFIKYLMGNRCGQIEDVEFEGAKRLIDDGFAEDVYDSYVGKKVVASIPTLISQPEVKNVLADQSEIVARRKAKR
jgi:hypothetical protein